MLLHSHKRGRFFIVENRHGVRFKCSQSLLVLIGRGTEQLGTFSNFFCSIDDFNLAIQRLKMGHPRPLLCSFSSFQTNITIFTTNKCEKCPSSIRCWDSNPRTLEPESSPTRAPAQIRIVSFN